MKNLIKTSLLLLLLLLPAVAEAYDFVKGGIYYNITGTSTVEVTYGKLYQGSYSADVAIPAAVIHSNKTYSVTAIGERAFESCRFLTSVVIPHSVAAIKDLAFRECISLTGVTIPNSVTSIGERVFFGCTGLTSITVESGNPKYDSRDQCNAIINSKSNTLIAGCKNTVIPNSVTSLGYCAFNGCYGLMSITIPNSVTSIGNRAFASCYGLAGVTIPNSVISIGSDAFDGCSGLTSIVVESGNPKYDSRDSCNAIIVTSSRTLITGCKNTVIPNSVNAIGECAFRGCIGLMSIDFPNSVRSIGWNAFHDCRNLKSVTFGNSLTTIDRYAFEYCRSLKSVTIPKSVTVIGIGVFSNCDNLAGITVESGNRKYDSRDSCNAIIETSSNTLIAGCNGTVIPSTVTAISMSAFVGCCSLKSITIPRGVTYIGHSAFFDCYNLAEVYSFIVDPSAITMNDNVFYKNPSGSDYSYRTLHVPHGTAAAYQADSRWYSYFGQIVEMEPEAALTGDVNLDGNVDIADVNAVVDIIMGENGNTTAADVNGDGEINLADINAIIEIIQGGDVEPEHE